MLNSPLIHYFYTHSFSVTQDKKMNPSLENIMVLHTREDITLRIYSLDRAAEMNHDLSASEKIPGWFILGDDDEDGLFCVHPKHQRCAIIPIDPLSAKEAMDLPFIFDELFSPALESV